MKIGKLVLPLACLLALSAARPAAAEMTIYNNTDVPLYVWVASYYPLSYVDSLEGGFVQSYPSVFVKGWWKIEPFGGFVKVPDARQLMVIGPNAKRQERYPDKNRQIFPMMKEWKGFTFSKTYTKEPDPYDAKTNGWGKFIQANPQYEMRMFCPLSYFADGQGGYRITKQRLGW